MPPIPYPLISGNRFDWSCVTLTVDGLPYTGVKSISYRQSLSPGEVRGTRAQVTGRTRGQYTAEGSIELYKEDYQALILALSAAGTRGYMEHAFTTVVQYSSGVLGVVTDTLTGCRLTSDEDSPSESGDALTISSDLSIMYLLRNGLSALSPEQLLR
jgi:hypothetical protein